MMKKVITASARPNEIAICKGWHIIGMLNRTISKKISLLLVMALMGSTALMAQKQTSRRPVQKERPSSEEIIQQKVDRMTEKLNLTEEQSAEIKALMEKHQQIMDEDNKAFQEIMKQHREKMKNNREALDEDIKSSLNEEQLKAYEEMKENARKRFQKEARSKFRQRHAPSEDQRLRQPRSVPENTEE
ncbi:hypothetical protein ACT29H_06335 [Thermophagus sp. OGC60D27]|uniref:hypothetical protein n=1 Tax=Thermophagus sp. OGC60D27 TaxID=3458415 RepID=UPI0040376D5F